MKTQDLLLWGAVGVGAYLLWTQMAGASTAGTGTSAQPSQGVNAGTGYGSQVPPWASNYSQAGWPPGGGLPPAGGYGYGYGSGWSGGGSGPWGTPSQATGVGRRRIRVH